MEGRTLGIIGFGVSGQELARRAKAFRMRIMGIDVRPIEQEILDEIQLDFLGGADDTDRVIAESDFLSVHLHLTQKTRHIIDARRIGLMKPTAYLINVARGGLVDESALYEALMEGRIGGAGLDAFAQEPPEHSLPVYQLLDVCVTPHNRRLLGWHVAETSGVRCRQSGSLCAGRGSPGTGDGQGVRGRGSTTVLRCCC